MATATSETATAMQLQPYIFFYGRCEEALEFYKKAIGGTYEMQRMDAAPPEMSQHVSADQRNRVMHASFTGSGISFLASDGRETKTIDPEAGNISLALNAPDRETGERIFKALAQGGTVNSPLEDAFWGGRFGDVVDRFGIEWMITSP
jgi:PhnB protein